MIDRHYLSCRKFLLSHEFGEAGKVSYSPVIKLRLKVNLNKLPTYQGIIFDLTSLQQMKCSLFVKWVNLSCLTKYDDTQNLVILTLPYELPLYAEKCHLMTYNHIAVKNFNNVILIFLLVLAILYLNI